MLHRSTTVWIRAGLTFAGFLLLAHDLRANAYRVCREGKPLHTFPDLIALTRLRRKIFLELAFHALEFFRVGRLVLLLGDVRPAFRVFGVDLEPLFQPRLGIRLDRVRRALRLAYAAINA